MFSSAKLLNKVAAAPGVSGTSQTTTLTCDESAATPATGLCISIFSTPKINVPMFSSLKLLRTLSGTAHCFAVSTLRG